MACDSAVITAGDTIRVGCAASGLEPLYNVWASMTFGVESKTSSKPRGPPARQSANERGALGLHSLK